MKESSLEDQEGGGLMEKHVVEPMESGVKYDYL